jgi:UDP-glucose 4-epimerase
MLEYYPMKIVITGATGFIGSHVAVRLAGAGHEIVATGRNPRKVPALGAVPGITLARLELGDPTGWAQALTGADVLVHVALGWGEGGLLMLQADTAASVGLFEAAHAAGVRRIIYTSSTAANGEQRGGDREDFQPRPTDYYGATKASTEMFARAFARKTKVPVHVIRPGYIFGEPVVEGASVYSDKRFLNICRAVRAGQPVHLIQGDGTQFLHASSLAKVYEALLTHEGEFSIHYALSKEWCSWEDIARMAMAWHGREVPIELENRGYGPPLLFDVSAIERDFDLAFNNRDQLRTHVKWVLTQP